MIMIILILLLILSIGMSYFSHSMFEKHLNNDNHKSNNTLKEIVLIYILGGLKYSLMMLSFACLYIIINLNRFSTNNMQLTDIVMVFVVFVFLFIFSFVFGMFITFNKRRGVY